MSDDEEVHVVIEDAEDAGSTHRARDGGRSSEDLRAETARYRAETARLNKENALTRVNAALLTIDTESKAAKSEYARKMEEGDFDGAADAQARLAAAEARRTQFQAQGEAIQRQPATFEERLNQYTPATADWMRQHRDWVEDPRKSSKLAGAHHLAVSQGHQPDSTGYFDFVEKFIGLRDVRGGNNGGASRDGGSRVSASSNSNDHVRDGGKTVILTAAEKKAATDGTLVWNYGDKKGQPLGVVEVARRKAAMHAEGRYYRLGER
jgi:hypothetical protein